MPLRRVLWALLLALPAWSFTFVQTQSCVQYHNGTNVPCLFGSGATTTGNTIWVQSDAQTGNADPNSFKLVPGGQSLTSDALHTTNARHQALHYTNIPAGTTGISFTCTNNPCQALIVIEEVAAQDAGAFNVASTNNANFTPGGAWTGGANSQITVTQNYTVVFAMASVNANNGGGALLTGNSGGWTQLVSVGNFTAGSPGANAMVQYRLTTSTADCSPCTPSGGGGPAGLSGFVDAVAYQYVPPSYSMTVASPASGFVLNASANWTLTNISNTGNVTMTISDGGKSGTVTACSGTGTAPYAIVLTNGWVNCTFTYTPASGSVGTVTITWHVSSGTDPTVNTQAYTVNPWTLAPSGAGCTASNLRTASGTCTLTLTCPSATCAFTGSQTLTLSDGAQLGTFVSGASGNPLARTPSASATTLAYTYNPYLAGTKKISITSNSTDIQGLSQTFLSSSTDASTFTCGAGKVCNFGSSTNWTCAGGCGHTSPDTGDMIVATGGQIVVPAAFTGYVGSCPANNTNADVLLTPSGGTSGILEIAGTASLRICGNVKLNAPVNANPTTFGTFQLDTGAELDVDQNQNASIAYRIFPVNAVGWNQLLIGTSGDTCTFSSGSCPTTVKSVNQVSGVNFRVEAPINDAMAFKVYGAAITDCGSTTVSCITAGVRNPVTTYADADTVDVEGNVFNRTGTIALIASGFGCCSKMHLTVADNRFTNDLAGFLQPSDNSTFSAVTCNILRNYFSKPVGGTGQSQTLQTCTWSGNVFGQYLNPLGALVAVTNNVFMAAGDPLYFDWNQLNTYANLNLPGISRNIFFYVGGGAPLSRHIMASPKSSDMLATRNLCFAFGPAGEGHCLNVGANPASTHYVERDNLSIPTSTAQGNAGQWFTYDPSPNPGPGTILWMDHNGIYGQPNYNWGGSVGHGAEWATNTAVQSYRDNVHWSPANSQCCGGGPIVSAISYSSTAPGSVPANPIATARVGYNSAYNSTASATFGPGVNANCNVGGAGASSLGTMYDVCTTTAFAGHDITGAGADPKALDNSRNPLTWSQRLHGADGTVAGFQNYLETCQKLDACIEEARAWVMRGFQPTNLTFKGKAHDGRIVGFSGTFGSGYTGSCSITVAPTGPPAGDDLGHDFSATCTFNGSGVPQIQIINSGANYRIASPATVTLGGTCGGGCTAASLVPIIAPHDLGPSDAQMAILASVM